MNTDHDHNGTPRITDKRGTNRNPAPQTSIMTEEEQLELLRQQAAADDSTPIQDPDYKPVLTAFLVVIGHDGTVSATSNIELINELSISREAVLPDMYSAAAHIMKDVAQQETAVRVMDAMRQQANAAREQMMAERVAQQMQPRVQARR